jgi:hypothetical protein
LVLEDGLTSANDSEHWVYDGNAFREHVWRLLEVYIGWDNHRFYFPLEEQQTSYRRDWILPSTFFRFKPNYNVFINTQLGKEKKEIVRGPSILIDNGTPLNNNNNYSKNRQHLFIKRYQNRNKKKLISPTE